MVGTVGSPFTLCPGLVGSASWSRFAGLVPELEGDCAAFEREVVRADGDAVGVGVVFLHLVGANEAVERRCVGCALGAFAGPADVELEFGVSAGCVERDVGAELDRDLDVVADSVGVVLAWVGGDLDSGDGGLGRCVAAVDRNQVGSV